jgi:hypothetical protein
MFTVYKITNLINKKYYIGVHKITSENNNYMGSGPLIKKAINKYGLQNFKKEILFTYETEKLAYDKEAELLKDVWNNDDCYNLNEGGKGSWSYVNESGINEGDNNVMRDSVKVREIVKEKLEKGSYHTEKRKNASIKNSRLGIKARTGMKDTDEVRKKRSESVRKSFQDPNVRQRQKNGLRKHCKSYLLVDPNGVEYNIDVISDFCKEHDLPLSTITVQDDGKTITKGKAKGWTVYKN